METNPFSSEMKRCPYAGYDRWRESAPLVWSNEIQAWLVTTYEAARTVLADHRRFSSKNSVFGGPQIEHHEFPSMINRDEPDHRQLRAMVTDAFSARHMEDAWEPRIREYIEELLDAVEQRGDGRLEVVADLAYPLPVQMIAEIIGVPPAFHGQFKHWSNLLAQDIGRIAARAEAAGAGPRPQRSEEEARREIAEISAAMERGEAQPDLFFYFYQQIYLRRDDPRDDLISRLVQAEVDDQRLTDNELIAFLVLLLVAGNETTTNLITQAARALATHPEVQARVRADRSLVPALLDEAMRWESPIQGFFRRANEDAEVAGVQVRQGEALLVLYGAANHDAAKYEDAATFNLDRFAGEGAARDHLAFGHGIHYCLGANLARMEAELAINGLLDRFRTLDPMTAEDAIEWWDTPLFRGPKAYELRIGPV